MTYLSRLIEPRYVEDIGRVAIESAWLELTTDMYIRKLARLKRKTAEALLDGRMMGGKLELLKSLGRANLPDTKLRNEFSDIVAAASAANTNRNTVIHGIWSIGKPQKKRKTTALEAMYGPLGEAMAQKRTSPGNYKTMKASEVAAVATALAEANKAILVFAFIHWPKLLTPAQRHRQALAQAILNRAKTQPKPQGSQPRP